MPVHHFTTPRVVYMGLAHGERGQRQDRGTSARAAGSAPRPAADERVAQRRAEIRRPGPVR